MFKYDILVRTELGVESLGMKTFYNTDGKLIASEWVRKPLKGKKTYDCPQMTSAVKYRDEDGRGKVTDDHIGYMLSNANSIQSNSTNVALFSTGIYKGNGFSVTRDNFERVVTLFAARKLISPTWLNEKDEYFAPDTTNEKWLEFYYDSIVFSLFNNGSEQSSLKSVIYKNTTWDINNEFFWMSNSEIIELAGTVFNHEIMCQYSENERFVYNLLFGDSKIYDHLSDNARMVLDSASQLLRNTMIFRGEYSDYDNQVYNWDSGYSQLKNLWKTKFPEEFNQFRQLYKTLENRMRPLVYELGFLMK
jgi:hypothetical protein